MSATLVVQAAYQLSHPGSRLQDDTIEARTCRVQVRVTPPNLGGNSHASHIASLTDETYTRL